MAVSPYDGALWREHLGDPEVAALFSDAEEVRAMLRVEGALAMAQGALGIIPAASAEAIARAAETVELDPPSLAAGTASAGVPVPALVRAFRAALGDPEHAGWVHWGATSQDIVDTGLALRLARVLHILDRRLETIIGVLAAQAKRHRATVMAARTRHQLAVPTTLGARIATWGMPLLRHRTRFAALRPEVLVVTLGGAAGTRSALGGRGEAVAHGMADLLALHVSEPAPHSMRDGVAALGAWLALLTGSLGKMGQDLLLLGQSEVAEVRAGEGGGSSTMPQKANPVGAEALVTLARSNATAASGLFHAMLHAGERDGAAWALEWLILPEMCVAAAASLRHARALAETLKADPARMRATLLAEGGLVMAEAAVFALASIRPRPEAEAVVKAAAEDVRREGVALAASLARREPDIDWNETLGPERTVGEAPQMADRFVALAEADPLNPS
jgi:3-carboxy-cis,cis-muconate cycloisomerase